MEIAEIIKEWVWFNRTTQGALADKIGVAHSTVAKWCQGKNGPDKRSLKALRELGVEI